MKEIKNLFDRVADSERRIKDAIIRHGVVHETDPKKHRIRLRVGGTEEGPFLTPWIPYSQIAGTRKIHSVPSKGQTLSLYAPGGDWRQALAFPFTWSDKNPSPSQDGAEDIDLRGRTRRTQRDADLKQEVDGLTVHKTKQSHKITVHKDPQTPQEGQGEEVSDAKPWKGNRAGSKHKRTINKDAGYDLTINDGEQNNEHKIIAKPEGKIEHSVFNGRNKSTIDQGKIRHSVDNDDHYVDIKQSEGIKLKTGKSIQQEASTEIIDTAPMIHHHGLTEVFGTLNIGGNMNFLHELAQTIMGGATPGQGQQSQPGAAGGNLNVFGITNLGNALNVAGMASMSGGLNVSGDASLSGGLSASGDASFGGPINVDGAASLNSGANISGDTSLDGDLSVTGASSLAGINVSGPASFAQTVEAAGLMTLNGGLTGALQVAKIADGGLTHATMGLKVTGKVTIALANFADDAAAAAGGIAVGQLYRNGSVVMVRVA